MTTSKKARTPKRTPAKTSAKKVLPIVPTTPKVSSTNLWILDQYPSQKDHVQRTYFLAGLSYCNIIKINFNDEIPTMEIGKPSRMDLKMARLFFSSSTWRHHVTTKSNFDKNTLRPDQEFFNTNLSVKPYHKEMALKFLNAIGQKAKPKFFNTAWTQAKATLVS